MSVHVSPLLASLLACASLALSASPVRAADGQSAPLATEMAALRAEVERLRAELDALKAMLQEPGRPPSPPAAGATAAAKGQPAQASGDPRIDVLQSQVAELAQTRVEAASRFPVRLFGTVHAHSFTNTGEANWLDIPNIVPVAPADGRVGSFASALRQTRLGLAFDGPAIGRARTSGVVAFDFFGGIPGFQTGQAMGLPRLLVAYARLEGERTALHVGQDHMVLAPRDPSSLAAFAFPALFRSGNLYLRAPQITVERQLTSSLRVAGGLMTPNAGDLPEAYRFVPPALAGERSRLPAFQARLGYARGMADDRRHAALGVSGHYGRERRGAQRGKSWATAVDVSARHEWFGMAGEAFTGENIDAFGGGAGLDGRTAGGWAELQLFPTTRLRVNAGAGIDALRHHAPTVPRRRNRSAYGNVMFALTPELETSVEYWWLATRPGLGQERRNQHLDWVLVYRF